MQNLVETSASYKPRDTAAHNFSPFDARHRAIRHRAAWLRRHHPLSPDRSELLSFLAFGGDVR